MRPHFKVRIWGFLFLISAFDPDLKMLKIFYEESNKDRIKERVQEEFLGKFDSRILEIEKHYNQMFPTLIDEFEQKH